jgi:hypothetical protein
MVKFMAVTVAEEGGLGGEEEEEEEEESLCLKFGTSLLCPLTRFK